MSSWSLAGGVSLSSRGPVGLVRGREMFLVSGQYERILKPGSLSLSYLVEVSPLVAVTDNSAGNFVRIPDKRGFVTTPGERGTAFGGGLSPVGLTAQWRPADGRVVFFVSGLGGFVFFNEAVPFANTSRFNFTGEVGWGAGFAVTRSLEVAIEYRTHHMSNAGTADENPGLDARLWLLRLRRR